MNTEKSNKLYHHKWKIKQKLNTTVKAKCLFCQQKLVPKFIIKDIGLTVSIVCQSNWDINGEQEK